MIWVTHCFFLSLRHVRTQEEKQVWDHQCGCHRQESWRILLEISKDIGITINEEKILADERWDGWKGYITNTNLEAKEVISQYHGLWVVEKAFRITKGNLEMRPIFHFTERRIEAHICICFIAYKVYKELERILKKMKFPLSVDKVLEIAKTIPTVTMKLPYHQQKQTRTLFLTDEHRSIKQVFDLKDYFG